jgi:hypothetical protein
VDLRIGYVVAVTFRIARIEREIVRQITKSLGWAFLSHASTSGEHQRWYSSREKIALNPRLTGALGNSYLSVQRSGSKIHIRVVTDMAGLRLSSRQKLRT